MQVCYSLEETVTYLSCLNGETKANVAEDSLFGLYGNFFGDMMVPRFGGKHYSLLVECPHRYDMNLG